MAHIINGTEIAKKIHAETTARVASLKDQGITVKLAVILVGDDEASALYVKKKGEAAKKVGMEFELHAYPQTISQKELENEIKKIQQDPLLSGLIVQLPIPENFYPAVLNAVDPTFDVDCLTHDNLGKIVMGTNVIVPPTPGAVLTILKDIDIELKGKTIVVIGAGVLVGKPLSILLMNEQATVITCNEFTPNIKTYTLGADIIISGVGKKHIITEDMVKEGAVVIDAGVDFENNQMFGDVHFEHVQHKASHITPTPGGVGPLTVAHLLLNTATLATLHSNQASKQSNLAS